VQQQQYNRYQSIQQYHQSAQQQQPNQQHQPEGQCQTPLEQQQYSQYLPPDAAQYQPPNLAQYEPAQEGQSRQLFDQRSIQQSQQYISGWSDPRLQPQQGYRPSYHETVHEPDQSQVRGPHAEHMSISAPEPVSPIQHHDSGSLDPAIGRLSTKDQSQQSFSAEPQAWHAADDEDVHPSKPSKIASATFDFSQGGPSDWERFDTGADDKPDDTDANSREQIPPSARSPPHPETAELPSVPSLSRNKRKDSETTGISAMDDEWPMSPSAPAPLNIRRPISTFVRTPAEATKLPPASTNTFNMDDGAWIPPNASVDVTTDFGHAPMITTDFGNIAATSRAQLEGESAPSFLLSDEHGRHPSNSGSIMPMHGLIQPPRSDKALKLHSEHTQVAQNPPHMCTPGEYTPTGEPERVEGNSREAGLPKPSDIVHKGSAVSQVVDIAPGLDGWYKTSLQRYLGMLYREGAASSLQERHRIFADFMADEARARGIEPSSTTSSTAGNVPALGNTSSEKKPLPETPKLSHVFKDNSQVGADTDGEEYSPGGRPMLVHVVSASQTSIKSIGTQTQTPIDQRSPSIAATQQSQTPIHAKSTVAEAIIKTDETPTGTYKAYRHSISASEKAPSWGANVLTPTSPATEETGRDSPRQVPPLPLSYKPYSPPTDGMKSTHPSVNLPAIISPTTLSMTASRQEHGEVFLGRPPLLMSNKVATPAPASAVTAPRPVIIPQTASQDSWMALRAMLPHAIQAPYIAPQIHALRTATASYTSDFAHIQQIRSLFNARANAMRARSDAERRNRLADNEARNNELFETQQIDYAELKSLEDRLKVQEAERMREDGKEEYDQYLRDVFESVYARLQFEIGALEEAMTDATILMQDGVTGREMLTLSAESATFAANTDLAQAVELVLDLHDRLEARHTELAEIVSDRDQRYKRIETASLYLRGDIQKMRTTERSLNTAVQEHVAKSAEDKVDRAQRLCDDVDEVVRRGVEQNQDLVDELVKAVDGVDIEQSYLPSQELEGVIKTAKESLRRLTQSSQALMQAFHVVECGLNTAEYEASVANAKLDGAPQSTLDGLGKEWQSEGAGLTKDVERRVRVVEEDLRSAEHAFDGIGGIEGKEGQTVELKRGDTLKGWPDEESEKQERMRTALTDAKRRNGQNA